MIDYKNPKASADRIKRFAARVQRRLLAAGDRSLQRDDIEQELWIAWCKAVETYDPKYGATFPTYLYRGMQLHINRYVEKNVDRRHDEVVADSIDFTTDEKASVLEVIDSHVPLPDEAITRDSSYQAAMTMLSPKAQMFLSILHDQPEEFADEIYKVEQKALYARDMGIQVASIRRLNAAVVFDVMGVSRNQRKAIIDEITSVGQEMSR